MATVYYDSKTGKQVTTLSTRPVGGNPLSRDIEYYNIATGNTLTTVKPSQPQGFKPPTLTDQRRDAGQQAQTRNSLATSFAITTGVVTASGRPGILPDLTTLNKGSLAQRTAGAFADELYSKYENLFFANQMKGLEESLKTVRNNLPKDLANFRAKYTERDESQMSKAISSTFDALKTRAQQGTPAPPAKLFGFLPVKVTGLVQNLANLGLVAAGAYGADYLSAGSKVATVSGGSSVPLTSAPVSSGGFVGNLGIRGAQAANLSAATPAGTTAAAAYGVTPLTSSGLVLTPTGLLATTPGPFVLNPVQGSLVPHVTTVPFSTSGQAARLGVPQSTTPSTGLAQSLKDKLGNQLNKGKEYVQANPVKAALGAAGAGLTLKQISEQDNPLAALVNTISSGLGIGPIIPTPKPGPSTTPPNFQEVRGTYGGGGGGGGSYGGTTVHDYGQSLFPIMGIVGAMMLLLFLARR